MNFQPPPNNKPPEAPPAQLSTTGAATESKAVAPSLNFGGNFTSTLTSGALASSASPAKPPPATFSTFGSSGFSVPSSNNEKTEVPLGGTTLGSNSNSGPLSGDFGGQASGLALPQNSITNPSTNPFPSTATTIASSSAPDGDKAKPLGFAQMTSASKPTPPPAVASNVALKEPAKATAPAVAAKATDAASNAAFPKGSNSSSSGRSTSSSTSSSSGTSSSSSAARQALDEDHNSFSALPSLSADAIRDELMANQVREEKKERKL